ncbi:MAG: hypothetical protein U0572_13075 [Phycisphaerales bacterium]
MTEAPGGGIVLSCLIEAELSSTAGTFDARPTAPAGQMALLDGVLSGTTPVESLDLSLFTSSMRMKLPSNFDGVFPSGDVFDITVGVRSGSASIEGNIMRVTEGSELVASGRLLHLAGWAWYAGLESIELSYGGADISVDLARHFPIATLSKKLSGGSWQAVMGANGQPVTWWLDPCELSLPICPSH